jgi:hypothetical protein
LGGAYSNLIDSEKYREVFPQTLVADDQKAAGKWSTSAGGQYYAAGVGGALAGRGADLFVIDDPHSEQDVKSTLDWRLIRLGLGSRRARCNVDAGRWDYHCDDPLVATRPDWALIDYQTKNPEAIPWEIVELPAILNEDEEDEKSLWPEQWSLEALEIYKSLN